MCAEISAIRRSFGAPFAENPSIRQPLSRTFIEFTPSGQSGARQSLILREPTYRQTRRYFGVGTSAVLLPSVADQSLLDHLTLFI